MERTFGEDAPLLQVREGVLARRPLGGDELVRFLLRTGERLGAGGLEVGDDRGGGESAVTRPAQQAALRKTTELAALQLGPPSRDFVQHPCQQSRRIIIGRRGPEPPGNGRVPGALVLPPR
ncbi:hypothetical protein OG946_01300 [Streptomyces sp. NBC_01808]|uniref:hypothetical protein n=1 Tax=Streptomyces sp. NBC_01808 TaxID=2975947 RepID=UPI002DDBCC2F|nr:hypothetical protein [Streptomyces sp. NBC_01808]WSA36123.1 hypothetical protein OG946_01300 [Streptomyces sp. NBC_01808]